MKRFAVTYTAAFLFFLNLGFNTLVTPVSSSNFTEVSSSFLQTYREDMGLGRPDMGHHRDINNRDPQAHRLVASYMDMDNSNNKVIDPQDPGVSMGNNPLLVSMGSNLPLDSMEPLGNMVSLVGHPQGSMEPQLDRGMVGSHHPMGNSQVINRWVAMDSLHHHLVLILKFGDGFRYNSHRKIQILNLNLKIYLIHFSSVIPSRNCDTCLTA